MFINNGKKILILTGKFGEGHHQVAKAIQEAASIKFPFVETQVVDFIQWAYPNLFPISRSVYIKGIKTFPKLYGFLYKKTYKPNYFSKSLNNLFLIGLYKMLNLIQVEKPSVVISTFPFSSNIVSKLKELGLTNIPLITVITDHTHHSYWLYPCTDQYIVGSNITKKQLIRAGISPKKVAVTGIPIRTIFLKKLNHTELLKKYELLSDMPTVLIMGGGEGLIGKGLLLKKTLDKIPYKMQLIILCGYNTRLKRHLKSELCNLKHPVKLMGYTENVNELMAISDIVVTKPGGVTTSEALAMQLPMLLYKPMPGQERDNANYLIDAEAAVQANSPTELILKLSELFTKKQALEKMKKNIKNIQVVNAVFSTLNVVEKFLFTESLFIKEIVPHKKVAKLSQSTISFLVKLIH